jgi:SAM-dependent methyltransferase
MIERGKHMSTSDRVEAESTVPRSEEAPGNFWSRQQPGLKWLEDGAHAGITRESYDAIRSGRYRRESHLEEVAEFNDHSGEIVVEVGCGIGTDGSRFAEGGARYLGMDRTRIAVRNARATFDLLGLKGTIIQGDATNLPMRSASIDFVYSHGVLHHFPGTAAAVDEIHRVLRPGGRCLIMLYHKSSFNYYVNILTLRRIGSLLLLLPGGPRLASRLTAEPIDTLEGHRALLRRYGLSYLTNSQLFLANNTNGPGNPYVKVYSRREARDLFHAFSDVQTEVRYLNLRILPLLDRALPSSIKERLARRWGWFLYVRATR